LDSCLGGSSSKPSDNSDKETASKTGTPKADTVGQNKEDIDDAAVVSDKQKAVSGLQSNLKSTSTLHEVALSESRDSIKNSVAAAMIPVSQSPETNAFVHMMKQSQQVFSVKEPLRQRFHLHCDGHVTWTDTNDPSPDRSWSSTVLLKGSRMLRRESTGTSVGQPRDVELTISSSIPSEMSPKRLVTRHSRLSVPVLKSILQKSVRRRRPLPAVRVAMELMDKATGEILRRLPIIILEDSSLHPDFPLLVWTMVAESKDYVVPPQLITRIMCTVYEMASCPWTDYIHDDEANHMKSSEPILLSSSIPICEAFNAKKSDECEVLIRSILLRAEYGGMTGDMKMLHDYSRLWKERFVQNNVPLEVIQRAKPNKNSQDQVFWIDIPTAIHQRQKLQSATHVEPLVQRKLEKLTLQDICLAGVDFHCSSVLDQAIRDDSDYERCYESLCAIAVRAGLSPLPASQDRQRSHMMHVMKSCMWKFSSSVNHRRPLVGENVTKPTDGKEAALKRFWDETLATSVDKYMKQYVGDRLAR